MEFVLKKAMQMKKEVPYIILVLSICSFLFIADIFAQGPPPPPPPPCPVPPCPTNIPIDGGISLLIAAGVAYGSKKIHDSRKK